MRSECKKWTFELRAITNENSYRKEEKKEKKGKISFQTKPLDQSIERACFKGCMTKCSSRLHIWASHYDCLWKSFIIQITSNKQAFVFLSGTLFLASATVIETVIDANVFFHFFGSPSLGLQCLHVRKSFTIHLIIVLHYSCLWNIHRPWQSQQSIEDELLLCHPVNHETECHKATCQWSVKQSSRLTKDWPGASVPLFVSNTLMRAVKLSNALLLPSGTNNGMFNLPVLSDINKRSHKENRRVPAMRCTDMFTKKERKQHTNTS